MSELPLESLLLLVTAAFAGGIAAGVIGFGTGAVVVSVWLHLLQPVVAVPLMALCAMPGQLQIVRVVWKHLNWKRLAPLLGATLLSVPLGIWLLLRADPAVFRVVVGFSMAAYASWRLLTRGRRKVREHREAGPVMAGMVGFVAGFCGGFAGLSGPLVSLWASLNGWSKDEQRAVYQPLMLTVGFFMLINFGLRGMITWQVLHLAVFAIPAIMLGIWVGVLIYRRLDDVQFETIILMVILASGLSLGLRSL